jgi:hypothetical protein
MGVLLQMPTTSSPRPYDGFEKQFINGAWRPGHVPSLLKDTNPYTGEILLEIPSAEQTDVDEAYRSAAQAQPVRSKMLPFRRGGDAGHGRSHPSAMRRDCLLAGARIRQHVPQSGNGMGVHSRHCAGVRFYAAPCGRTRSARGCSRQGVPRLPQARGRCGRDRGALFATRIEAGTWPTSTMSQCSISPTIPSAVKGIQVSAASARGPSRHLRRTNG